MKKIIGIGFIMAVSFLAGCGKSTSNVSLANEYKPFMLNKTYNEDVFDCEILVDKETKVEYIVIDRASAYGKGVSITPRYNPDGTLKISQ